MVTIAFWKPHGVLSKFTDDHRPPRLNLSHFITIPGVYGAGRLDRDSEGLLILSDSPRLREYLTNPASRLDKTYLVQVEGIPNDKDLTRLESGLVVRGKKTRSATVSRIGPPQVGPRTPPIRTRRSIPDSWISLTLTEGRNRQVRRMTAAVGHPTLRLVRWSIGPVNLDGLTAGEFRHLDQDETNSIQDP